MNDRSGLRTLTTVLGALALFAAGVVAGVAWARLLDDDGGSSDTAATTTVATTTTVQGATTVPTTTVPPTTATTVPTSYVVQSGDTLTKIANQFGTTVAAIVALNQLENPDRLSEGQVLQLPPPTVPTTVVPPLTTVAPTTTG